MWRIFKIGVTIAVVLAVATVLIAPTIEMPETTLREHSVASHTNGNPVHGSLLASHGAGPSYLPTDTIATHPRTGPQSSNHARVQSDVLRC